MANYFKIPLATPFKFVRDPRVKSIHFDDNWACQQIRDFQLKAMYYQKWLRSKTTKIQVESTLAPGKLQVLNVHGVVLKEFNWTLVVAATNYGIYEALVDLSDVSPQTIYLYIKVEFGELKWETITNPISLGNAFPYILECVYSNSFNRDDIAWRATGMEMRFFLEADIQDIVPRINRTDYVNEARDTFTLDSTPFREFTLAIGDAPGVAEWVIDLMNRIFGCDRVVLNGIRYTAKQGEEFKITRVKSYPLVGASLGITESHNLTSLEYQDDTEIPVGIVMAYNIETGFFSPPALIPILVVENNG